MDERDLIILRNLADRYPVRFLEVITGIGYSTINRFINGADAKISTIIKLIDVFYDGLIDIKYDAWKTKKTTKP